MDCVLFDFDGTLTRRDSFRLLVGRFLRRSPARLLLIAFGLPLFIATGLLRMDKRYVKSWILWCCTIGAGPRRSFADIGTLALADFAQPQFWNDEVCERLMAHRQVGERVIVCTASGSEWVAPMLAARGLVCDEVIGSVLAYRLGGIILASPNCYAQEKVKRMANILASHRVVASYSDHPSDLPMLNRAEFAWIVNPKPRFLARFKRKLTVPWKLITD
jgi:phosphatidylglycerophosphatase C